MSKVLFGLMLVLLAQPPGRYQFDAAGRPARIDQVWELRQQADGSAIDIFLSLARCGPRIFLSDTQSNVFRLDAGLASSTLSRLAGDAQGLGRPTALAADCARQRLYVVNGGPRNVAVLDTESGKVLGTHPILRDLYSPNSIVLGSQGMVYIGGLWNQNLDRPLPRRQTDTFYEDTSIGQRLALDSGTVSPALAAYEHRCVASGACQMTDLDAIGENAARGWIAAHGTSTRVAIYDARGTRTSTLAITSPKFVRDGAELTVAGPASAYEQWRGRNSVIRRVFAIGPHLVVVHSKTIIGPAWVFGETPQLEVFMNVYAADGSRLVSDVRLPDLPIGKDATHLYAIDYGPAGRGNAPERVRLVRIPVAAGAAAVQ